MGTQAGCVSESARVWPDCRGLSVVFFVFPVSSARSSPSRSESGLLWFQPLRRLDGNSSSQMSGAFCVASDIRTMQHNQTGLFPFTLTSPPRPKLHAATHTQQTAEKTQARRLKALPFITNRKKSQVHPGRDDIGGSHFSGNVHLLDETTTRGRTNNPYEAGKKQKNKQMCVYWLISPL